MTDPRRPRRLLALAAAYVIALQALLLPLSVAAGVPLGLSLCSSGASIAGSQAPASHQSGCPCAGGCGMQCCVHALAGSPQSLIALDRTQVGALSSPAALEAIVHIAVRRPQLARAPPSA